MMKMKKLFKHLNVLTIAVLLLYTVTIASASPVTLDVTPIDNSVIAGQTATYRVDLINPSGSGINEGLIDIYVEDSTLAGVTYTFSETTGTISEGTTKTITLSAYVPDGKPVGSYTFDVKARVGTDFDGEIIEDPEPYQYLNVILDVEIPEFPTVAIPVISVLGIMFLMSRGKRTG